MLRILSLCLFVVAAVANVNAADDGGPFVFAYFNTGEQGQSQGLQLAYSRDGYRWTRIDSPGDSFFRPTVGGRLLRDPSIVEGSDGTFHMVWTTDWQGHGIGVAHSKDLVHWSGEACLDVMEDFPGWMNCWAPEITYDAATAAYLIYWASTVPGRFPETEDRGDILMREADKEVQANHRIYVTTTKDFKTYTPTRLLFDDGYNCIDAFLVRDATRNRWVMIVKNETAYPEPEKNLRVAYAQTSLGPWSKSSASITPNWVEGPAVLKVGDQWLLYYDAYTRGRYEGLRTTDLEHWAPMDHELVMPEGMRHGTPFGVSEEVLQGLLHRD